VSSVSDASSPTVRLVRPTSEHVRQVASLRWESAFEGSGPEPVMTRPDFVEGFLRWWEAHEATHWCVVGLDQDAAVVAYGFVALTARVPGALTADRKCADVQAVFVAPTHRNAGVGGQLINRLVELAREQGAEHVTVHANDAAVTAYQRAGFTQDPLMLNQLL
jgi:GNAT superfamily N-acetyltransferase